MFYAVSMTQPQPTSVAALDEQHRYQPEHRVPESCTPEQRASPLRLPGHPLSFTAVPVLRVRADGWSPLAQERFVLALDAMGSVGAAARSVGMSRNSAYRLRERPGAASFAEAWDRAIEIGKARAWNAAMERALDGITTITVRRGGSVSIAGGMDFRMANAAMRGDRLGLQR